MTNLITTRRNFLTRASAVTVAGATIAVPIVTLDDARARAQHHVEGLKKALNDLYPQSRIDVGARFPEGEYADPRVMSDSFLVTAKTKRFPAPEPEYKKVFKDWRDYDRVRAGAEADESMFHIVDLNAGL
jgi:hypothetical protein